MPSKQFKPPKLHVVKLPNSPYKIIHYDCNANVFDIQKIEALKNAKYIGEFSLKTRAGIWADTPVSIFYQEEKHPEGSNYFGIYRQGNTLMIADGISATETSWEGVLNPDTNEILYSAYHHDFQEHGVLMADGGQEYLRASPHPVISFKIKDDKIVLEE